MIKVVIYECVCWPQSAGLDVLNVTIPKNIKNCNFTQHAECVAPIISHFEPSVLCECPPKCLQDETLIDSIQYGKYQSAKIENPKKMLTSIMIYLKPEHKYDSYLMTHL